MKLSKVRAMNRANARKQRKANPPAPTTGVNGGFRAGKRKRGNSLLKRTNPRNLTGYVTESQFIAAREIDPQGRADVTSRHQVCTLHYRRTGDGA